MALNASNSNNLEQLALKGLKCISFLLLGVHYGIILEQHDSCYMAINGPAITFWHSEETTGWES